MRRDAAKEKPVKCTGTILFLFLCCVLKCPAQNLKPNRAAFLNEVLDARPTSVTPKFDSYHAGYYYATKQDLLDGLTEETKKRGLKLRCVSIVGPVTSLWAYYITIFVEDKADSLRANTLVFAHARITSKRTGRLTVRQYVNLIARLDKTGLLKTVRPAPSKNIHDNVRAAIDYGYNALLAGWSPENAKPELRYGILAIQRSTDTVAERAKTKTYLTSLDDTLRPLTVTFPPEATTLPRQHSPHSHHK